MSAYSKCLMQNWGIKIPRSAPLDPKNPNLKGFIDNGEVDVTYPVNPVTGMRETQLSRALDSRTPAIVRNQLLNSIEQLPPDMDLSGLSDEDKLTVCKSKYCQSRPEMARYYDYLKDNVIKDLPEVDEILNQNDSNLVKDSNVDDDNV